MVRRAMAAFISVMLVVFLSGCGKSEQPAKPAKTEQPQVEQKKPEAPAAQPAKPEHPTGGPAKPEHPK